MTIKLLRVIESNKPDDKRYKAEFDIDGKFKTVYFGDKTKKMNYTIHNDDKRREAYISRHKKDLNTDDPTRAGYLSMFILWNKKTLKSSIQDYKQRLKNNNWTPL